MYLLFGTILGHPCIIVRRNSPSWRHRRCFVTLIMDLVSPTLISKSSFVILSVQLIFPIRLHSRISNASWDLISVSLITHFSQPYKATLRTNVFKNVLFISLQIFFETEIFFLWYKLPLLPQLFVLFPANFFRPTLLNFPGIWN